ncbi:MAG TPA: TRAP transporter fused permease subunit [Atribacterota bacterium]|nr:TRAP transporter fused permease subunit [Atribacterota bacterium]
MKKRVSPYISGADNNRKEEIIVPELSKKERTFNQFERKIIQLGMALLSFLILYWAFDVTFDMMTKRALYLMLVLILCTISYPFSRGINKHISLLIDYIIIFLILLSSFYIMYQPYVRFARLSSLNSLDIFLGIVMIMIGLDIGRRVIGWSLTLVAGFMLLYALFGNIIPGMFGHTGFSVQTIVSQIFCGMEGFYGMVSRIMIQYVIPFILFGAFLEETGAGEFFIKLAFSLTGKTVGGPAKAAIIGSALLGSVSGSAIANVSSTGVFTIPMMKRIGYPPHIAGAIEASASTGGQIMPPVMGAVAFIMVELTQIPYLTIISVAALPIILYYITLYVFVHIEARKQQVGIIHSDNIEKWTELLKRGWYYFFSLLFIIIVMVMGFSPNLAALSGIIVLVIIHMIQKRHLDLSFVYRALVLGGKHSLYIGSIVPCIGIILAMVGLSGLGLKISWFLSGLSNESTFLAILLVGLISTILGMGLPSSAAYIIVAITAGPSLIELGFPVLIAHMIMIWFSINSEITPPVGLASIVGAGIAGANPVKTMFTAFKFSKGLYILPFLFYYRPAILLQGNILQIIETIIMVLCGLIAFAIFWERYVFGYLSLLNNILILFSAIILFLPYRLFNYVGLVIFIIILIKQNRLQTDDQKIGLEQFQIAENTEK